MKILFIYVNTTKKLGLSLKLKFENDLICRIKCYVDSDWDGDKDTRRSVSFWMIEIHNCVVEWGSRGQKPLSS